MSTQFWRVCSESVNLINQKQYSAAEKCVIQAQSILGDGGIEDKFQEQRRQYIQMLKNHLFSSSAAGQQISTETELGDQVTPGDKRSVSAENLSGSSSENSQKYFDLRTLEQTVQELKTQNSELLKRVISLPSIDPLSFSSPDFSAQAQEKEEFGIIVFGHTRLDTLEALLESLSRQNALQFTEVWLDGFQGNPELKKKTESAFELASKYPVKLIHRQAGLFGFRKMLIQGLINMCSRYRDVLVLEDDCFPTRDAVSEFRKSLDTIRDDPKIFSVYGHHFLTESETETCARFQGWGWATTSEKLSPVLRQLIDCYSMTEEQYLRFVDLSLTDEIQARIDVTPPRQPSVTLKRFFAWDETLGLLVALNNQLHRPTRIRTIYNCGMNNDSTHFGVSDVFRQPPFNLITPDEVWQYF